MSKNTTKTYKQSGASLFFIGLLELASAIGGFHQISNGNTPLGFGLLAFTLLLLFISQLKIEVTPKEVVVKYAIRSKRFPISRIREASVETDTSGKVSYPYVQLTLATGKKEKLRTHRDNVRRVVNAINSAKEALQPIA